VSTRADGARIEVRGLTRRFGDVVAVHPLDLDVGPGGVTGLLGPNGSGKSTLLRMLIGLVRPHGGSATVAGARLEGDGVAVRSRTTYAPGEIGVYGEMLGREHLRWLVHGRDDGSAARAIEIAERLELPLHKRVRGYSHGMKRQLLFAAALAPKVPVRVLDEPTEGLDPSKRGLVLDILAEDAEAGTTILLSSHHLLEVDRACDRLVFLNGGRLVADAEAAQLRADARRLVKLTYRSADDARRVSNELSAHAAWEPRARDGTLSVVLESDDPRPFFAFLASSDAARLPVPETVEYGSPSLQDLYRALYGVEGV
jgi:ABC-2 type transport system ATP-binding protein